MIPRKVAAEADVQDTLALPGEAPRFLGGDECLARPGAAPGDDARVGAKPGEELTLLVGKPHELPVGSLGAGPQGGDEMEVAADAFQHSLLVVTAERVEVSGPARLYARSSA